MKGALRASCVRCNAVLASDTFEQDWSFARCAKCGARSPVPETVRRARPEAFISRMPRALDDVAVRRPRAVEASADAVGTTLTLRARRGEVAARVGEVVRAFARLVGEGLAPDSLPTLDLWSVVITATTDGDRVRLERPAAGPATLAEPLAHAARATETGFEIVIRGGQPVSDEWVAGVLADHAHAEWVGEWIAAQLRAHLAATRTGPSARGTRGYRG